jgi:asparagine synthase (glutamine-hydrolysing)
MCGICGIYHFDERQPAQPVVLERMSRSMTHRGPDGDGTYYDSFVALGHRRLSIIDIDGGAQPMSNETGSVWISFNGEIYNYVELREELVSKGHHFRSRSDTEVIVHAYEEYGIDCVHRLNGMFAFGIWDTQRKRLFLARDRLGIKPLYYTVTNGAFLFASEIKALLEHPDVCRAIDLDAVPEYLFATSFLGNRTMFRGITALPAGHTAVIEGRSPTVRQYWDVAVGGSEDAAVDEYAAHTQAMLADSVRLRLMSDVPFGSLLSGGLDSSIVSAVATQHVSEPLKTFSIEFSQNVEMNRAGADVEYARHMAKTFDTDHHEFIFAPQDYYDCQELATWHLEKPVELTTPSLFLLHKSLKPHITVVLSGEGADELFGGYYFFLQEAQRNEVTEFPWAPYSREVAQLMNPELAETTQFQARMSQGLNDLLSKADGTDFLNRILYLFVKVYLIEMLERQDKTSMAWSVEARVPFLDHRLVEYAFTMPSRWKLNGDDEKYILKKAFHALLPERVRERKKKPFPFPVDPRSIHEQRGAANDLAQSSTSRIGHYFDKKKVEDFLYKRNGFSSIDNLAVFRTSFALISLEMWHRAFRI